MLILFKIKQDTAFSRYKIVIPLFAVALALIFIDSNILWRYFSWANQTLAAIALWAAAYLKKCSRHDLICVVPAMFMTVIVTSYILIVPEGLGAIWR